MCTAISFGENLFGRNLDLYYSYHETVTVTSRNFEIELKNEENLYGHYAFIGMAFVCDGYPLYYDCVNEFGVAAAGLNFPENAYYQDKKDGMHNIASFEFLPWIMSKCKNMKEVRDIISKTNITNDSFSKTLKPTPLHFLISYKDESITVEPSKSGLKVYENKFGVLTNNPEFNFHLNNINNYMRLTNKEPENNFSQKLELRPFGFGMGAIGLPGDFSSSSRFVKASFVKENMPDDSSVSSFFKILESVAVPEGAVMAGEKYNKTIYSCSMDKERGIYYFKTYNNSRINAADMRKCDIDDNKIFIFEITDKEDIKYLN